MPCIPVSQYSCHMHVPYITQTKDLKQHNGRCMKYWELTNTSAENKGQHTECGFLLGLKVLIAIPYYQTFCIDLPYHNNQPVLFIESVNYLKNPAKLFDPCCGALLAPGKAITFQSLS